jgi:hypothetical protein
MEFIDLVSKLGFPAAIVAVMGLSCWRIMVWLRPRVDQVIDAHLVFVNSINETMAKNTKALEQMAGSLVCRYETAAQTAIMESLKSVRHAVYDCTYAVRNHHALVDSVIGIKRLPDPPLVEPREPGKEA